MDSEFDERFIPVGATQLATSPLPRLVTLDIPLKKVTRHVHVAMDAYVRTAADKTWRAEGELRFTKFGSPVLTIPIIRGNTQTEQNWATRQSGGGTQQPSLIFESAEGAATQYQTAIEIPSWQLEVEADQVSLYVKMLRDDDPGTTVFVYGLRIQSQ